MMRSYRPWVAHCTVALLLGCTGADDTGLRARLVERLETDRQAHLSTNADLLLHGIADTLHSVSGGVVTRQPRAEVATFFRTYFVDATYHAWEDVAPPVIRMSGEGTMAWVIRTVRVDREEERGGEVTRRQFTSAYTATYAHGPGGWKMTSVTSTFLPDAAEAD